MKKNIKLAVLSTLFVIILIFIDQFTKILAVKHLMGNGSFVLIPGVLEFTYLENTGAAFSMLESVGFFQTLMTILTPVICLIIIFSLFIISKQNKYKMLYIVILFILAGAIGNYIDRILNHYVVDFIYFSLIDFPVFNVADIYVTLGFIVMAILILFKYKDEEDNE